MAWKLLNHNSCNLNDHHLVAIRDLKQSGAWVSGVIGTVDERKNQRLLIEAAREIPSNFKVHFFIVGEGEETVMLKELCIKYELMDRFTFTGYKENGHELTHFFDLLISTSRSEGGPPFRLSKHLLEKLWCSLLMSLSIGKQLMTGNQAFYSKIMTQRIWLKKSK